MNTYEKLTPIFHDIFDNDEIQLSPDLDAAQVKEWDSLGHVRLMVTIEQKLGISFSTAELTRLKNVGELVSLIDEKLEA